MLTFAYDSTYTSSNHQSKRFLDVFATEPYVFLRSSIAVIILGKRVDDVSNDENQLQKKVRLQCLVYYHLLVLNSNLRGVS